MICHINYTGSQEALIAEARRLAEAKFTLYGYVKHVILEAREGWQDGVHIRTICDTVQAFLERKDGPQGLIVTVPPRHMKSTIISNALPAWYISNHPQADVIMASYSLSLARDNGRACRQLFQADVHHRIWPYQVFSVDSADAYQLRGKENGRPNLVCAGVGGPITGKGADLFLIDDPVKDAADASSDVYKRRLYEWYKLVVQSRMSPGGKKLLIMTRWSYDDLAGSVLRDDPGGWDLLNLPAIGADGQALWPERYDLPALEHIRAVLGSHAFEAQYQGRPAPEEGGTFRRAWFRPTTVRFPANARRVRYWDKAATHSGGDWTVGCLLAEQDGRYCVEDIVRLQGSPAEVQDTVRRTAAHDGPDVAIRMEQEPGSSGVDIIDHYARHILPGYDFRADKVTGSKQLRAGPLAAALENGNVDVIDAGWTRDYVSELCEFPLGAHDDQVDATSGAYTALTQDSGGAGVFFG